MFYKIPGCVIPGVFPNDCFTREESNAFPWYHSWKKMPSATGILGSSGPHVMGFWGWQSLYPRKTSLRGLRVAHSRGCCCLQISPWPTQGGMDEGENTVVSWRGFPSWAVHCHGRGWPHTLFSKACTCRSFSGTGTDLGFVTSVGSGMRLGHRQCVTW